MLLFVCEKYFKGDIASILVSGFVSENVSRYLYGIQQSTTNYDSKSENPKDMYLRDPI